MRFDKLKKNLQETFFTADNFSHIVLLAGIYLSISLIFLLTTGIGKDIQLYLFEASILILLFIGLRAFNVGGDMQQAGIDGSKQSITNRHYKKWAGIGFAIAAFIYYMWHTFKLNIPFYQLNLRDFLYSIADIKEANANNPLDRFAENVLDTVTTLASDAMSLLLTYTVFFACLYIKTYTSEKKIRKQLAGDIIRGIELFEDIEDFKEKLQENANEFASEPKKDLEKTERIIKRNRTIFQKTKAIGNGLTFNLFSGNKVKPIPFSSFSTARITMTKYNIPIFEDQETKGIIFFGGAGSGKTQGIYEMLLSLSKWEKKNYGITKIIYDMKHDFYKKMYRHGKDVLILPGHINSAKWNLFREFVYDIQRADGTWRKYVDMKTLTLLAEVWIPVNDDPEKDTWPAKGRLVLICTLITVANLYENPSLKDLIDFVMLHNTKEKLRDKIGQLGYATKEGYDIEPALDDTTAGNNTYSIFSKEMVELRKKELYYDDSECNFSVREFMSCHTDLTNLSEAEYNKLTPAQRNFDKRLILVQDQDNDKYFSTYYRMIFELVGKKTLSLREEDDKSRRILFLFDEAASLGNLKCILQDLPEKGRSKGAMVWVGVQTISSFYGIYTKEGTDRILANLLTKIVMKITDEGTREFVNKLLGETEYEKSNLSSSEQKSGGNVTYVREKRPVVLPNEFDSLRLAEGYYFYYGVGTKLTFFPDKSKMKTRCELVRDLNMKTEFKTEFGAETEENLNKDRENIILGIVRLRTAGNAVLSASNLEKYTKLSVSSNERILKILKEEKTQILEAIDYFSSVDSRKLKDLSLEELSNKTGLSMKAIEDHWIVFYLEEQQLIEKINKVLIQNRAGKTLESLKTENITKLEKDEMLKYSISALAKGDTTEEDIRRIFANYKQDNLYPENLLARALDESVLNEARETEQQKNISILSEIEKLEKIKKDNELKKLNKEKSKEIPMPFVPDLEDIELSDEELNDSIETFNGPDDEIEFSDEEIEQEIDKQQQNKGIIDF